MKVFTTKYALTQGIDELDVAMIEGDGLVSDGNRFPTYYRLGRDCFLDRTEAFADAEKRRKNKIAQVKRQLAKLEALVF